MSISIRCLLLGHDDSMVRAPERLRLRCDHCGRETSGWTLGGSDTRSIVRAAPIPIATGRPMTSLREDRAAA
jgi:hypothetical protein